MGRAKLSMELITKEKSRCITYKKRKEGLKRKMHEFTTLCDVKACLIIFPKQENCGVEPEIWPENVEEVRRIIDIYKAKSKESGSKTFGVMDFFHDRKRRIEDELSKLRKKNMETKYPSWFDFMNSFSEAQLRSFGADLGVKMERVKERIDFCKSCTEPIDVNLMELGRIIQPQYSNFYMNPGGVIQRGIEFEMRNQQVVNSSLNLNPAGVIQRGIEFEMRNQQVVNSSLNLNPAGVIQRGIEFEMRNQQVVNSSLNLNPNAEMANDRRPEFHDLAHQFGGSSTSSFKRQIFYESTIAREGVDHPAMCHSPIMPLAGFYAGPPPLPPPPPYMMPGMVAQQLPMMAPPPQLPFFSKDEPDHEDFGQFHFNSGPF